MDNSDWRVGWFLSFTEATKNILVFAHHSVSVSEKERRWRRKRSISNVKNTIEPHFLLSSRFDCKMPRLIWARTTSSLSLSTSLVLYVWTVQNRQPTRFVNRYIHSLDCENPKWCFGTIFAFVFRVKKVFISILTSNIRKLYAFLIVRSFVFFLLLGLVFRAWSRIS